MGVEARTKHGAFRPVGGNRLKCRPRRRGHTRQSHQFFLAGRMNEDQSACRRANDTCFFISCRPAVGGDNVALVIQAHHAKWGLISCQPRRSFGQLKTSETITNPHGALYMRCKDPEATFEAAEIAICRAGQDQTKPFSATSIKHHCHQATNAPRPQKILKQRRFRDFFPR